MPKAFTQDEVKNLIESDKDYRITKIEYKNQRSKIEIKHNLCGSIFITDLTHWKDRGQRCPKCNKEAQRKTHNVFIKELEEIQPGKYTVLGKYINKRTKIRVKCNICGHESEMLSCNLYDGQCGNCRNIESSRKYRKSIDEVNNSLPEGYTVVGEYINNKTPVMIKHSCGHEFLATTTNIRLKRKAQRCPKCFATRSLCEISLSKEISDKYTTKLNYRFRDNVNKHKFKEIDIYVINSNIGIEFDGIYWHSTDRSEPHNLLEKTEFFKQRGIPVIHVFEDEWNLNQDIIKTRLDNILSNHVQYIQDPQDPSLMIPFQSLDQTNLPDTITIDRRWFIDDTMVLNSGFELSEILPPKEFYLTNACDQRYSKKSEDCRFSIFDCGYYIYKRK